MRKEQLTAFIDRVIAQGETIRTHVAAKTSSESPATNWYPRVMSVFHLLGSRADPWKSAVAKCPTDPSSGMTDKLLGALKAIREAVDQGLLADIEDAAHEEAFVALLEQARQLASDGLYVAAGTVGQTVLQEHLQEWCTRTACLPKGSPSAEDLSMSLYRHGHLAKAEYESIISISAVGEHCIHNRQPPIAGPDVQRVIDSIRDFVSSHPLS